MRHHYTTDPIKKMEHIAEREANSMPNDDPELGCRNWFQDWLDVFRELQKEFMGENKYDND